MKKRQMLKEEVREEAVKVLYNSLKSKQPISKEECYEIYDRMQRETLASNKMQ